MAIQLQDRIFTLCTTVGTNDAIIGATNSGYQGWEGISLGNTVYYCITDNTDFEEYYLSMENIQASDPFSSFYFPIRITGIGIKLKSEQQTGETYSGSLFFDNMRLSYPKKISVSIEENPDVPTETRLQQNYPNPFNPTTVISFRLAQSGVTTLKVYDMLGREVSTLLNENMNSGTHNIPFNGSNLASGIYIYQLSAKGKTITRRMTLIK